MKTLRWFTHIYVLSHLRIASAGMLVITAGALAFVEVLRAAFERGFFDIGIFVSPQSYGLTIRCWATIRDTVGWLIL